MDISSDKSSTQHLHFTMAAEYGTAWVSETMPAKQRSKYSFATTRIALRQNLLLDNQSSVHIMCNPDYVSNIRAATGTMQLKSNGGKLPIKKLQTLKALMSWYGFWKEPSQELKMSMPLALTARTSSCTKHQKGIRIWCLYLT